MTDSGTLRFQIRTRMAGNWPRHLLIDRITFSSSLLGGLYESHLAASSYAPSSVEKHLGHVAALLSWDAEIGEDVSRRLYFGQPMTESRIRQFKRWLETRAAGTNHKLSPEQQQTVNTILQGAAAFEDWCLRHALARHGHQSRLVDVRQIQKEFWKNARGNVPQQDYADDFTDDEILAIEQYLRALAFEGTEAKSSEAISAPM